MRDPAYDLLMPKMLAPAMPHGQGDAGSPFGRPVRLRFAVPSASEWAPLSPSPCEHGSPPTPASHGGSGHGDDWCRGLRAGPGRDRPARRAPGGRRAREPRHRLVRAASGRRRPPAEHQGLLRYQPRGRRPAPERGEPRQGGRLRRGDRDLPAGDPALRRQGRRGPARPGRRAGGFSALGQRPARMPAADRLAARPRPGRSTGRGSTPRPSGGIARGRRTATGACSAGSSTRRSARPGATTRSTSWATWRSRRAGSPRPWRPTTSSCPTARAGRAWPTPTRASTSPGSPPRSCSAGPRSATTRRRRPSWPPSRRLTRPSPRLRRPHGPAGPRRRRGDPRRPPGPPPQADGRWPTFAGSPTRDRSPPGRSTSARSSGGSNSSRSPPGPAAGSAGCGAGQRRTAARSAERLLAYHPIVVGDQVLVADERQSPRTTSTSGPARRPPGPGAASTVAWRTKDDGSRRDQPGGRRPGPLHPDRRRPRVYARIGPPPGIRHHPEPDGHGRRRQRLAQLVVALDRSTEGKILWKREAGDIPLPKRQAEGAIGPPCSRGRRSPTPATSTSP